MKVRCGPHDYTLKLVKKVNDNDDEGEVCFEKRIILLKRNSNHLLRTTFHELFHAELRECGFNCNEQWNEGVEEICVEVLSQNVGRHIDKVIAFLKKNKQKL